MKIVSYLYPLCIFKDISEQVEHTFLHFSYVLGGTHMTNPALLVNRWELINHYHYLLVNRILKELTATEDTFYG